MLVRLQDLLYFLTSLRGKSEMDVDQTGRLGDTGQSKTSQKKFTAEQIYLWAALFCFYTQRQRTAPRKLNGADAVMQIQ